MKTPAQRQNSVHEPSTANEKTIFKEVKEHLQNCLTSPISPTEPHVLWLWISAFWMKNFLFCCSKAHNLQFTSQLRSLLEQTCVSLWTKIVSNFQKLFLLIWYTYKLGCLENGAAQALNRKNVSSVSSCSLSSWPLLHFLSFKWHYGISTISISKFTGQFYLCKHLGCKYQ